MLTMVFLFLREKFNFRTKLRSRILVFIFLFYDFLVFAPSVITSKVFYSSRFRAL